MPYGDGGGAVIFASPDNSKRKHPFLCSTVLLYGCAIFAVESLTMVTTNNTQAGVIIINNKYWNNNWRGHAPVL